MKKLFAILLSLLMLTSCTNKSAPPPEVSSLTNLKESNSSDTSSIKKEMPAYPVFANTDWGMTPDEVLSVLGWNKDDWKETKYTENKGTRLAFTSENADIYGTKAHILFVFSTDPKRDIGLIEVRVVCVSEESVKTIKAQLDEKYGKAEGSDDLWKTGSLASEHPKWNLIVKAMIRETEETNAKSPNGGQLLTEGLSSACGKEPLAIVSYMPLKDNLKSGEPCGVFFFGGYSAAWANSLK